MPSWTIHSKEQIFEGELSIFKIRYADGTQPDRWYYELKIGGKRIRKSTKRTGLSDAIDVAKDRYFEAKGLLKAGLNPDDRMFRLVAAEYLNDLRNGAETGYETRSKLCRHEGVIENYLNEFFASKKITEILESDASRYKDWRRRTRKRVLDVPANEKRKAKLRREWEKSGDYEVLQRLKGLETRIKAQGDKTPSPATMNTEMTVLRGVLKFAQRKGYLTNIPDISNYSLKNLQKSRPAFSPAEMTQLLQIADELRFSNEPISERSRKYRHLLYYFIKFGYLTGLRTTEQLALIHADIQPRNNGGTLIDVRAEIEGAKKTGPRRVIASDEVFELVSELRQQSDFDAPHDFIFCHPQNSPNSGTRIKSFKKGWAHLMKCSGLERDETGNKRTMYSLRHSYINEMLNHGTLTMYQLAENVGNSPEIIRRFYGKGIAFDNVRIEGLLRTG